MYHYQENIQDGNGTVLNGWSMGLYAVGGDPATATAVTIYSDRAGTTPIPGGTVRSVTKGYVNFYVPSGRYSRRYYDASGALQWYYDDTDMVSMDQIDYIDSEVIDFIDFGAGVMPSKTRLGRPVKERVNGTAGTLTRGFDANGFYVNTNPTGRGGAYVVVDAGEPITYQYAEFIIKSGGSTSPNQSSYVQATWNGDITANPYVVPATGAHQQFTQPAWEIDSILTPGAAINAYANGAYPSGALLLDTVYQIETCYIDNTFYRFFNGKLIATVTNTLLSTLQGNWAGFEIFKNNPGDGEPGMRRLAYSSSNRVAIAVRDRYLAQATVSSGVTPDSAYVIRDDFISGTISNGTIGALGWSFQNFGPQAITPTLNHPGLVGLVSTNVAGVVNSLYMGQSATVGTICPNNFDDFAFEYRENAAGITDYDQRVGMMQVANSATPSSWIGFEKLSTDTNWFFVSRNSGTQTRVDTGVVGGVTDWMSMRVRRISSTEYRASINGSTEVPVTTNVINPSISLLPVVMIVLTGSTARRVDIDYFALSIRSTTR